MRAADSLYLADDIDGRRGYAVKQIQLSRGAGRFIQGAGSKAEAEEIQAGNQSAHADSLFHGAAGRRAAGHLPSACALGVHAPCGGGAHRHVDDACVPVPGAHGAHGGVWPAARLHAGDGAERAQSERQNQAATELPAGGNGGADLDAHVLLQHDGYERAGQLLRGSGRGGSLR